MCCPLDLPPGIYGVCNWSLGLYNWPAGHNPLNPLNYGTYGYKSGFRVQNQPESCSELRTDFSPAVYFYVFSPIEIPPHASVLQHTILSTVYNIQSYIRKGKCRPATPAAPPVSRSGDPPWILKWAGLESSGRRLNS